MSSQRFVLIDCTSTPHNPKPSARRRFRWLLPVEFGKPDKALASHVCNCIFTATPKMTFKGVRAVLRPLID